MDRRDPSRVSAAAVGASGSARTSAGQGASLPSLDGRITFDPDARQAAADDFGHLVHRMAEGVLLPASSRDVAVGIRWAAQRGCRFAARGRGHSVFGRSQVVGGVVADLSCLDAVEDVHDPGCWRKWRKRVEPTRRQRPGSTPPSPPDLA